MPCSRTRDILPIDIEAVEKTYELLVITSSAVGNDAKFTGTVTVVTKWQKRDFIWEALSEEMEPYILRQIKKAPRR